MHLRRRLLADETEQRRGGKRRGGTGGHWLPGPHPADVDDDGCDNVGATDAADLRSRGIAPRRRRPGESATPASAATAAAGTARIIPDGDGRVLVVHPRRARQNSALRERYPVPAGLAETVFVQQNARHIEVADER